MKRIPLMLAAAWLIALTSGAADDGLPAELPGGWSIQRVEVPAASRDAVAKKVGVALVKLENCPVKAGKASFKLNVATAADEAGARKLERSFVTAHGNDESFVARKGVMVAEITQAPAPMAARLKHLMGWTPAAERKWRVQFEAAPISETKNAMHYQPLFETLGKLNAGAASDAIVTGQLDKLRKDFTFGANLTLYAPAGTVFTTQGTAAGDRFSIPVSKEQKRNGVPAVGVDFTMDVREFSRISAAAPGPALTAATAAWPRNVTAIQALEVTMRPLPPAERVEKILAWTKERVAYGGKLMGSRFGVLDTLQRGQGRCWDASDVFVAACRACGVPARQVGGWVAGMSGHVWAEVWLDGDDKTKAGWMAVDPTTSWTGVSVHYIPWWVSEDGLKPLELWGMPKIERVK